ncbi:hypothetical protein VC83_06218 [Pseudogymnoascus destructans]|uniref:Uncharacterized protein n=2 Tax=Pseudogymnoascus destructans TaxID=655981 RepID=L8G8X3_PSED2|nr:uncharacterized protein VC83_06218 [Pseudogymnoascus destructans]ELR09670.1 hypothetical protein GMDG_04156 [Pseudogymnoascus destructans 20631-21]OAF58959.1 hypothetical protein VC83_06218 [Pseudogymnoascus destructans]
MANSGPPPARLCALSDLKERGVGEKVRVLGCITHYNTTTALLTLHPPHPPSPSSPTAAIHHHAALIDLTLLLSSSSPPQTSIGEWVNVIGYITSQSPPSAAVPPPPAGRGERGSRRGGRRGKREEGEGSKGEHRTSIQALLLWPAGSLNIQDYEQVVADLKAETDLKKPEMVV